MDTLENFLIKLNTNNEIGYSGFPSRASIDELNKRTIILRKDIKLDHPCNWGIQDVVNWLKNEDLNSDPELEQIFISNRIEGIDLIGLTPKDLVDELKIKSLRTRKNLYNSIQKLLVCIENIKCGCKLLREDLMDKRQFEDTPKEAFELQFKFVEELNQTTLDYEMICKLDSYFRKLEVIEENDEKMAKELNKDNRNNKSFESNRSIESIRFGSLSQITNSGTFSTYNYSIPNNSTSQNIIPIVKKSTKTFECGWCNYQDYLSVDGIEKLACKCLVCIDCLRNLFLDAQKDSTLMVPKCHQTEINPKILNYIMSPLQIKTYEKKLKEFKCEEKLYCPNLKCSEFIFKDEIVNNSCSTCGTSICFKCKNFSHFGLDCEFANQEHKFDAVYVQKLKKENGWQDCKKCNILIELSTGCNHITCRYCKYEFCYVCGNEWKGLSRCSFGCPLFLEKEEEKLLAIEIRNFEFENRRSANHDEIKFIREDIRARPECRHQTTDFKTYMKKSNKCDLCEWELKYFCYTCELCNSKMCKTCNFHRI